MLKPFRDVLIMKLGRGEAGCLQERPQAVARKIVQVLTGRQDRPAISERETAQRIEVGRAQHQRPAGAQQALDLLPHQARIKQVLDHLKHDHHIKEIRQHAQLFGGQLRYFQSEAAVVPDFTADPFWPVLEPWM